MMLVFMLEKRRARLLPGLVVRVYFMLAEVAMVLREVPLSDSDLFMPFD